eukprot:1161623-Pelagomonas_calceolata.AAC.8
MDSFNGTPKYLQPGWVPMLPEFKGISLLFFLPATPLPAFKATSPCSSSCHHHFCPSSKASFPANFLASITHELLRPGCAERCFDMYNLDCPWPAP